MEELFTNAIARVPAMESAEVKMFFNGPGGVHARRRLPARRDRRAGLLGRGRRLRARARRRGRHRQDHGRVDRRRPPGVGRLAARHPPLRPPVPQPGVHARALVRGALAVLRHQVPGRGEARRPAAARVAGLRAASGARRVVRREGRLGARQLVRVERRGRRRVAAPARLGGRELVAGDRGRGARGARGGRRCSTSRASRSSRCSARARSRSSSGSARTGSTGPSAPSSTRSS